MPNSRIIRVAFRGTLVAAFVAGLAACIPTSEEPILVAGEPPADSRLAGVWFGALEEGDELGYLHFIMAESNRTETYSGGMDVLMMMHPRESDEDGGWAWLYALTAHVAGKDYLSVEFRIDGGKAVEDDAMRGFHLYRYDIDAAGALQLHAVNEEKVTSLIEAGTVKGYVEKESSFPDIRITASSEELVAILETDAANDLFREDRGTFTRIGP